LGRFGPNTTWRRSVLRRRPASKRSSGRPIGRPGHRAGRVELDRRLRRRGGTPRCCVTLPSPHVEAGPMHTLEPTKRRKIHVGRGNGSPRTQVGWTHPYDRGRPIAVDGVGEHVPPRAPRGAVVVPAARRSNRAMVPTLEIRTTRSRRRRPSAAAALDSRTRRRRSGRTRAPRSRLPRSTRSARGSTTAPGDARSSRAPSPLRIGSVHELLAEHAGLNRHREKGLGGVMLPGFQLLECRSKDRWPPAHGSRDFGIVDLRREHPGAHW